MKKSYEEELRKVFAERSEALGRLKLNGGEMVTTDIPFQPLGISSNDGKIAIADYFMPAICEVTPGENGNQVSWIGSVDYDNQPVRLFSSPVYGDTNRAQTVIFFGNGYIVSRNGGRVLNILSPGSSGWDLTGIICLPKHEEPMMVHSATPLEGGFLTIESEFTFKRWYRCRYSAGYKLEEKTPQPPFRYGIAVRDGKVWTVTDRRCTEKPFGLYCEEELIVENIQGNGICFLRDAAVVSYYGYPVKTGKLTYIPESFLK